jgi:ubiquitin C-terminal hydrolase
MDSQNGYLYPAEEVNAVGTLRIGVSVESQIIITPSALNYNSREQTDMVGLANLGATCYLNALLQM